MAPVSPFPVDMDPWFEKNLVCPVTKSALRFSDDVLVSQEGRRYPVIRGVPIMLVQDVEQTLHVATSSLARSSAPESETGEEELYLETLGMNDEERAGVAALARAGTSPIDPVVSFMISATGGNAYQHLIGKLAAYPIPELRLEEGGGRTFLDIGCNWGRWSVAAARKGYSVVGLDPSLGAVMAARRVARDLGLSIRHVVGDARYLPFRQASFDIVFSYSVLQHFQKTDVAAAIGEIGRVLQRGGKALVQMPNAFGVVSFIHQARRRFRDAVEFEVRYWTLPELKRAFSRIGPTTVSVDCFFGLGLQKTDVEVMPPHVRGMIAVSERLRAASRKIRGLTLVADSVYVSSRAEGPRT